jgi:hypothetical protein
VLLVVLPPDAPVVHVLSCRERFLLCVSVCLCVCVTVCAEGSNNVVSYVIAGQTGCSCISVGGGDVQTLVPAGNVVSNNVVSSFARITRTYNPGVTFFGVGNDYSDNTVFDAPHQAIFGSGNNHLFSGNYVHDVCFEASDSGAWYMGRSWIERGNVIINNRFERVRTTEVTYLGYGSLSARIALWSYRYSTQYRTNTLWHTRTDPVNLVQQVSDCERCVL